MDLGLISDLIILMLILLVVVFGGLGDAGLISDLIIFMLFCWLINLLNKFSDVLTYDCKTRH